MPFVAVNNPRWRAAMLALTLIPLAACSALTEPPAGEGIGFRKARFDEMAAMREYRQCRDEALALDTQARSTGAAARYLASARMIEKCEAELAGGVGTIAEEERMRAWALSIQDYIKGGDAAGARRNLDQFKRAFPNKDLYLADGASLLDSFEVLLDQKAPAAIAPYATLNVAEALKQELRRVRYWKRN
ncbi:MAG: hypothetical protein FJX52_03530 [Alphaproteobacteria bacterium]|nr:hypothetical protein [Alphaproteobacteria bacterium]